VPRNNIHILKKRRQQSARSAYTIIDRNKPPLTNETIFNLCQKDDGNKIGERVIQTILALTKETRAESTLCFPDLALNMKVQFKAAKKRRRWDAVSHESSTIELG